ncbi:3'-5' exonuclease family protein [Thiohalorhabdus denitrificans]|uniref:Exonuclease n=1 Tax=Thiohalorhabdus denitrificans TaxID=381306 RepID=A0A1G5D463_9GAMM|nr:hypothetical protein [Thiohalorhabdus denitrificans]SCY09240.1 hypothetical protein SAMN05661077_1165 [Thiohalorhabdus denitrificans]
MPFFLDCEAASLDETYSYPIEVAWGCPDTGIIRSYLIDPTGVETWTDWDPAAQAVHGLSRGYLREHGLPPRQVAKEVLRQLSGEVAMATAWDDKGWVDELTLRTRGVIASIQWRNAQAHFLELARKDQDWAEEAQRLAWERLEAQGVHPHRAANDVRHLMETRKILLEG